MDQGFFGGLGTIVADATNFLLDQQKKLPKPWASMTAAEQGDQIALSRAAAERLVVALNTVLSVGERVHIPVTIDKFTVQPGQPIKGQITLPASHPQLQRFVLESRGEPAVLALMPIGSMSDGEFPVPQPDQPEIDFVLHDDVGAPIEPEAADAARLLLEEPAVDPWAETVVVAEDAPRYTDPDARARPRFAHLAPEDRPEPTPADRALADMLAIDDEDDQASQADDQDPAVPPSASRRPEVFTS